MPCGAGRLTRPAGRAGLRDDRASTSPQEFLSAAQEDGPAGGGPIRFRQADMRDLPWEGEFDAAFCFGNSFGYLDDAGNEAFLDARRADATPGRAVRDRLRPDGRIHPAARNRAAAGGGSGRTSTSSRTRDTTRSPGRIENRFTFSRDGRTETKLASQRVYTLSQLVGLLSEAGLEVLQLYGSPTEEPFALGSQRLLLVAEKRK